MPEPGATASSQKAVSESCEQSLIRARRIRPEATRFDFSPVGSASTAMATIALPSAPRQVRVGEDRPRRRGGLAPAGRAAKAALAQPPATLVAAGRADEALRPAHPAQALGAGCLGSEPGGELLERARGVAASG